MPVKYHNLRVVTSIQLLAVLLVSFLVSAVLPLLLLSLLRIFSLIFIELTCRKLLVVLFQIESLCFFMVFVFPGAHRCEILIFEDVEKFVPVIHFGM